MTAANPLEHTWCIWEQITAEKKNGQKLTAEEWNNLQKRVGTFNSVEDFWRYYNHLPAPSDVFYNGKTRKRVGPPGEDRTIESFSLFKDGIAAEWEDPANIRGGEWWLRKRMKPEVLDRYWENLVFGLVGCTIDGRNEITGARVVDKSSANKGGHGDSVFRIELWLRSKDLTMRETLRDAMIQIMTEGHPDKANATAELTRDFSWKMHGV